MKIPYLSFAHTHNGIREKMIQAFSDVYDSNWFILGERLSSFEREYAKFNNVKYCVGLSNGLDALHLALKVLGVGVGDEVIVPSNTYIATVLAVTYVGAKPIFVEPDIKSYNLDPGKLNSAISARTKVIMPVHLYGQACSMGQIAAISKEKGIFIVEDNAQAHGATFAGRLTGSWGDINGTSFYPGKNLGALGDGGAITTDNEELATRVSTFRNYGSRKKYVNDVVGYNMRLDEMQAALLSVKLPFLDMWTLERKRLALTYSQRLEGVGDLVLPHIADGASHVFHAYVIRTDYRDALEAYLRAQGIGTLIHYPIPPHLQEAYRYLGYRRGDFPIAEKIAETCLSLPIWPGLSDYELEYVVERIADFFRNC